MFCQRAVQIKITEQALVSLENCVLEGNKLRATMELTDEIKTLRGKNFGLNGVVYNGLRLGREYQIFS